MTNWGRLFHARGPATPSVYFATSTPCRIQNSVVSDSWNLFPQLSSIQMCINFHIFIDICSIRKMFSTVAVSQSFVNVYRLSFCFFISWINRLFIRHWYWITTSIHYFYICLRICLKSHPRLVLSTSATSRRQVEDEFGSFLDFSAQNLLETWSPIFSAHRWLEIGFKQLLSKIEVMVFWLYCIQ